MPDKCQLHASYVPVCHAALHGKVRAARKTPLGGRRLHLAGRHLRRRTIVSPNTSAAVHAAAMGRGEAMAQFVFGYTSSIEILDSIGRTADRSRTPRGMRPQEDGGLLVWRDLAAPPVIHDSEVPQVVDRLPLPAHALVSSQVRQRSTRHVAVHVWSSFNAIDDLVYLGDSGRHVFACPVELALVQLASLYGREATASLANQVAGTYRVIRPEAVPLYRTIPGARVRLYPKGSDEHTCKSATVYGLPPLTTAERIAAYVDSVPGMPGARRLRRVLPLVCNGLASPLEARIYELAFCSRRMGSLGLPKPQVNVAVSLEGEARRFVRKGRIIPDFRWPEKNVVLEALGWDFHGRPDDIVDTSLRDKAYRAMGVTCLTLTDAEVRSHARFEAAMGELCGYLGLEMPQETEAFRKRKDRLRAGVLSRGDGRVRGGGSRETDDAVDAGYLAQLDAYADANFGEKER